MMEKTDLVSVRCGGLARGQKTSMIERSEGEVDKKKRRGAKNLRKLHWGRFRREENQTS